MQLIPLEKRLKKSAHKRLSAAQDLLVDNIYGVFPRAVIHGGTAIWRCYRGRRFSEDVDVYLPKRLDSRDRFSKLVSQLKDAGFSVAKFKHTKRSVFSRFEFSGATLSFEAVIKNVTGFVVKPFEASDGTFMNVYTLLPEDLVLEKIEAYKARKKSRDLYDIWFLLNLVENPAKISGRLSNFVEGIEEPSDYAALRALIIMGPAPTFRDLVGGIRSWAKRNM